jgi:hypothetical protein
MGSYILEYKQPYEIDEDSPSGIGDHSIKYKVCKTEPFIADDDKAAIDKVLEFLHQGSVFFNHYLDGDGKIYKREPIKLIKIIELQTE